MNSDHKSSISKNKKKMLSKVCWNCKFFNTVFPNLQIDFPEGDFFKIKLNLFIHNSRYYFF